ncbi:MAG: hypothetical protein SVX38_00945 [Chloroflexota bacterium]|nr:hypothetical protein [Chloroflexota bacterium]
MKILDQYGVEKYEGGRNRVHLAIIKVSEGELSRLPELVKVAKADYRDVLAWAEYPRQIKIGFVGMKRLSPDEAEAIRREDREQYLQWLEE